MTVVDGDVLKVVVDILAPDSVICQNVYHYQLSDEIPDNPTDAQIMDVINTAMDAIYTLWDDEMNVSYTVDVARVDRVEWDAVNSIWEVVEFIGSTLLDHDGLGISDGVPHGVAANITFSTSDPKRRARKFFPGASEDGVLQSTWIAAVLTVLGNMGAQMLVDRAIIGSAELVPGIATNLGTFLPILVATVNSIAAYQRRRKPGVGS